MFAVQTSKVSNPCIAAPFCTSRIQGSVKGESLAFLISLVTVVDCPLALLLYIRVFNHDQPWPEPNERAHLSVGSSESVQVGAGGWLVDSWVPANPATTIPPMPPPPPLGEQKLLGSPNAKTTPPGTQNAAT